MRLFSPLHQPPLLKPTQWKKTRGFKSCDAVWNLWCCYHMRIGIQQFAGILGNLCPKQIAPAQYNARRVKFNCTRPANTIVHIRREMHNVCVAPLDEWHGRSDSRFLYFSVWLISTMQLQCKKITTWCLVYPPYRDFTRVEHFDMVCSSPLCAWYVVQYSQEFHKPGQHVYMICCY